MERSLHLGRICFFKRVSPRRYLSEHPRKLHWTGTARSLADVVGNLVQSGEASALTDTSVPDLLDALSLPFKPADLGNVDLQEPPRLAADGTEGSTAVVLDRPWPEKCAGFIQFY